MSGLSSVPGSVWTAIGSAAVTAGGMLIAKWRFDGPIAQRRTKIDEQTVEIAERTVSINEQQATLDGGKLQLDALNAMDRRISESAARGYEEAGWWRDQVKDLRTEIKDLRDACAAERSQHRAELALKDATIVTLQAAQSHNSTEIEALKRQVLKLIEDSKGAKPTIAQTGAGG